MSAYIRKCTAQVSKAKDRMLGINLRRLLSITEKFTQIRTTDTLETPNHLPAQSRQFLLSPKTVNEKEFLL